MDILLQAGKKDYYAKEKKIHWLAMIGVKVGVE